MSKPTPKRPMTEKEAVAILAMRGHVRFPAASWDKRFFRDVLCPAEESRQISEKSSAQLWRLFIRYRRQIHNQMISMDGQPICIGGAIWVNMLAYAECHSAPDFRKQQAEERANARIDEEKRKYQEALNHA